MEHLAHSSFVPLNVRSSDSFLQRQAALTPPDALVRTLAEKGYKQTAICDSNFVAEGRLFNTAKEVGTTPLLGLRIREEEPWGLSQEALIFPQTTLALRRLHQLYSKSREEGKPLSLSQLIYGKEDYVTILTGELSSYASYHLFEEKVFRGLRSPQEAVAPQKKLRRDLERRGKVVVVPEVRMSKPEEAKALEALALLCGESLPLPSAQYAIPTPEDVAEWFGNQKKAVGKSGEIAQTIHLTAPQAPDITPYSVKKGWTPEAYLRLLLLKDIENPVLERYKERIIAEIEQITDPRREGFATSLFLTKEIVDFCHEQGLPVKVVGSICNSLVASIMGITPLTYEEAASCDFSRVVNEQRFGRPDIDMEVGYRDKEQITQFLRQRYGSLVTDIISPAAMDYKTLISFAAQKGVTLGTEVLMSLREAKIPYQLRTHPTKLVLASDVAYEKTSDAKRHSASVDGFDTEKVYDYVAFDFLGKQGPQRLHLARDFALKRGIIVPHISDDRFVMGRIFSGDTLGIADVESPHMQRILQRMRLQEILTREEIAQALSISKPSKTTRERFFRAREGETLLSPAVVRKLHLSGPVLFQQEDLLHVAAAAGFSLEERDGIRKTLTDKGISHRQKETVIAEVVTRLRFKGFDKAICDELAEQMKSYTGYMLVKGHAFSLAHGVEALGRYAVYDPVGFWASVLTTVSDYSNQLSYTYQGYLNDAHRHGMEFVFPDRAQGFPNDPTIFNDAIVVSSSMLEAAGGTNQKQKEFPKAYEEWLKIYKQWKNGEMLTRDVVEAEYQTFGKVFSHNAIARFPPEQWVDSGKLRQRVIVQPIAYRRIEQPNGKSVYAVTLDSEQVLSAFMDPTVGSSHELQHPFLEIDLLRNNRRPYEWEIGSIHRTSF